ncbi:Transposon TX1 uncharacterized 149 kDa protein [Vitis vinifera]|uniref:Transposon TX1 uncharacterized 149 kDa protein n=1 Tax=Vitis vinifera TaxID=29760 RepID=A0A438DRV5_VITVI|nr:Transposon TX1 uncharacterized 149 kDa protein [Vitis vinifera]
MANAHRNNNTLDRVKIDGVWLEENQEVREGIANAFQQRLSEEVGWKADIEGIQLDRISHQEAESLEVPFSEDEIHSALMDMSGDKAPGPDGFTMAFWQSSWDFVKEEILEMFKEFHEQGSFLKSLNNTFLVLIPKKGGADDLGDFRPISLLGGLYKLMAKVLANRLKRVLNKVVAPTQNAFVMGRQSLMLLLLQMRLFTKWALVLGGWGGCGVVFLQPSSQFWLMGSQLASSRVLKGSVKGIHCCSIKGDRRHNLKISHLFFADDTIVFCEANKEHLTYLSWILLWFEAASGLRINLDKSEIIPVGVVEEIEEMAVELGCRVGSLPSQYWACP